jgi:hypothetical protein
LLLLPHSGTGNVNSYVAATNYDNPLSSVKALTQIDIEKKIDAFNDSIELMAG